jgi:hypothetical protein
LISLDTSEILSLKNYAMTLGIERALRGVYASFCVGRMPAQYHLHLSSLHISSLKTMQRN